LVPYRLYGLQAVSNRVLPGLSETGSAERAEVVLHIGTLPTHLNVEELKKGQPAFTSRYRDASGKPLLQIWRDAAGGHYCFQYSEGFTFAMDGGGQRIWARWQAPVTLEDVTAFLLGQIFAYALHLRGYVCLHASAVAVDGKAVLFAGEPGMGKSSTAAAFAEQGFPLVADDVSAIRRDGRGRLVVAPSFPLMRLWPDSAEFLYGKGSAGELPRVQPGEDKRLVLLERSSGKYQGESTPLGAIYLLAARSGEPTAPRIENIEDAGRLIQLLANAYVSPALGLEQRAEEFRLLGEICRSVPVRWLTASSDPQRLGRLCELVVEDRRKAGQPVGGLGH
jgi:hypothetical protein